MADWRGCRSRGCWALKNVCATSSGGASEFCAACETVPLLLRGNVGTRRIKQLASARFSTLVDTVGQPDDVA